MQNKSLIERYLAYYWYIILLFLFDICFCGFKYFPSDE